MGSWIEQPGADGRRHRLLDEVGGRRAGAVGRLLHGPALDAGDGRRHADEHAGPVEPRHAAAVQQQPDHALGDVEVGDRPLAQRAHRHDVARRPPDHLPGVLTHGQDLLGACVEGDHRGLVQHDALAPGVDEGVGRAEVDGEIPSHVAYRRTPPSYGVPRQARRRSRRAAARRPSARNAPVTSGPMERGGPFTGGDFPDDPDGRTTTRAAYPSAAGCHPKTACGAIPRRSPRLGPPSPIPPLLGWVSRHPVVPGAASVARGQRRRCRRPGHVVAVVLTFVDTDRTAPRRRRRRQPGAYHRARRPP